MSQKVFIIYHNEKANAKKWAPRVKDYIKKRDKNAEAVCVSVNEKEKFPWRAKGVIVLGGDGTILSATRKFAYINAPIFGLNLGRFGFLAAESKRERFLESVGLFLDGRFHIEERIMLAARIFRENDLLTKGAALNDVLIRAATNMVNFELSINNDVIKKVGGDGVLVSTSTGSTAHSLSAGGPIVMSEVKCFLINFLAPFSLPVPTIITDPGSSIEIKIKDFKGRVVSSIDGSPPINLKKGDIVSIFRSSHTAKLAFLAKNHFFGSLKEKFHL